ncbi:putative hydrolase or acyltransferase of alpha/beta superfamily [Opitutaceae bacterium TAV1]|nr:putative hydrolase or acyltransferase of alpha/beta superfamily [Opitutaceae bacterium TAV1]
MTPSATLTTMTNERLAGFRQQKIDTGEAVINTFVRGSGEPLLMLHGYPQTHLMWHKVAPALAEHYTVVLTDLRGYGDSSCPPEGENHLGYSKRAMARDQVEVMRRLGFDRFYLAGHDRGARVCHQLPLDYPEAVRRAALLDIIPTSEMYARTDMEFASIYFHWFFLILPNDLPEKLLAGAPEAWIRRTAGSLGSRGGADAFPEDVMAHYIEKFSNPAVIHATCEDYRAGATVDLDHLAAARGKKIPVPLLVLWAAPYLRKLDVLGIWRQHAETVTGHAVPDCGHFIAEEAPEETVRTLRRFFENRG